MTQQQTKKRILQKPNTGLSKQKGIYPDGGLSSNRPLASSDFSVAFQCPVNVWKCVELRGSYHSALYFL